MTSSGLCLYRSAHKWTGPAACCGLILYLLASVTPVAATSDVQPPPKRVLILYSFENEVGLYSDFDDLLRLRLRSGAAGRVEFYTEFLDLARFPDPDHEEKLQDVLRAKYSKDNIDLIFPVSLPAIEFIRDHGETLFPGVPKVFCAVDRRWMARAPLSPTTTGVVETTKITKTLEAALQLQPDTRHVVVVGGTLPYERDWMTEIQGDLREYEGKLEFTYLTDLPMEELTKKLANLPEHTVILYMMMWRDGAGENFLPKEALLRMTQAANAPIYGVFEGYLGSGIVGGDLVPLKTAGVMAAQIGLQILRGKKPAEIPVLSEDAARYVFDWRQLQRWHIREQRLPPESLVRFRQTSVWQMYKWRFALLGLLIAAETMLIAFLLIQRRKLMQAESSLQRSEERYRSLVESSHDWVWEADAEGVYTYAGPQCRELLGYEPKELVGKQLFDLMPPEEAKRVRLAFGELASRRAPFRALVNTNLHKDGHLVVLETNGVPIVDGQSRLRGYRGMDRDITRRKLREDQLGESERKYRRLYESMMDGFVWVDLEGRITEFNDAYCQLAGYEPEELLTLTDMELTPEKWHALEVDVIRQQVLIRGHSEVYEKEYRRKDGTIVPVESRSYLMRDENGTPCGKWSIVRDVGERKRAMTELQKSEEKFSKAFDASPVPMAILSLTTQRYIEANKAYEENTGFRADEIIGRTPDELGTYLIFQNVASLNQVLTSSECLRNLETQYRNKAGDLRTALLSTELIEFGGEPCILLVLEDITERKRTEQDLHELGARLLMVQEDERRRIARELHDDFSQRLALLAIDMEELAQQPPPAQHEWSARLEAMRFQTEELTNDLHRLSYQLHPSKLEVLGLVEAVRSYCHTLSRQAGLDLKFSDTNVPRVLPGEVSLCIYRVVQEALHNVVRHSGAKSAVVHLSGDADEVRLMVADSGEGFVVEAAGAKEGLGLVSMEERVRHVGGKLSIDTRPSGGTRISVRIPVSARQPPQLAAVR